MCLPGTQRSILCSSASPPHQSLAALTTKAPVEERGYSHYPVTMVTKHTFTSTQTHQLVLIKEGDEGVWDDLIEAIHEASDLEANCLCHSHLCH